MANMQNRDSYILTCLFEDLNKILSLYGTTDRINQLKEKAAALKNNYNNVPEYCDLIDMAIKYIEHKLRADAKLNASMKEAFVAALEKGEVLDLTKIGDDAREQIKEAKDMYLDLYASYVNLLNHHPVKSRIKKAYLEPSEVPCK